MGAKLRAAQPVNSRATAAGHRINCCSKEPRGALEPNSLLFTGYRALFEVEQAATA